MLIVGTGRKTILSELHVRLNEKALVLVSTCVTEVDEGHSRPVGGIKGVDSARTAANISFIVIV